PAAMWSLRSSTCWTPRCAWWRRRCSAPTWTGCLRTNASSWTGRLRGLILQGDLDQGAVFNHGVDVVALPVLSHLSQNLPPLTGVFDDPGARRKVCSYRSHKMERKCRV